MSRDQRVNDNWALIFAQEQALLHGCPLEVVLTLTPSYPMANQRHYSFMLQGLVEVERGLSEFNIPFRVILIRGKIFMVVNPHRHEPFV